MSKATAAVARWSRGAAGAIRHPGRALDELTGPGPVYALLILFGLNAVDELDRTAFGILLPEIREEFGLDLTSILALIAVVAAGALALQIPIAQYSDRHRRVPVALGGAAVWAFFSLMTGLVSTVFFLGVARAGSGIGKAVVDPTHNSLLADYYPPVNRPGVYSFHRAANALGQFLGPLLAGLLAYWFDWRVPFLVFAVPSIILVILGLKMREPIRGRWEREAMGASAETVDTEEEPASFAEAWRTCWKITGLRRIWYALPFLAASLIGFVTLASLFYEEEFGLNEVARGSVAAAVEPLQLVGLIIGARVAMKYVLTDPGRILKFLSWISLAAAVLAAIFALAPNIVVAVLANAAITAGLAIVGPGILASLSLAIPPRTRSLGFSIASLWVLPGLAILPLIGAIGDAWGIRLGMLVMTPVFLIGGLIIASAGDLIGDDIRQVWRVAAARSEDLYERQHGNPRILIARELEVGYDGVQVLFGVDVEILEGEIVALLGTNGAGKSTLLRAICGVIEADRGAVVFDGIDITHAPPYEIAARGVVQVPGGAGVFPSLTVDENLRLAGWLRRKDDSEGTEVAMARAIEHFPILGRRGHEPAGDLSGGQQQMLALGMALIAQPKLLMIDELSLGLAPVVVERLLPLVREIRDDGATVILVEQSVNLALTVADRAYFMEKGEIRFEGPAADLLDRPDLLRSVFLEGAGSNGAPPSAAAIAAHARPLAREGRPEDDGPAIAVAGLTRSFGGLTAVADVTFSAAPGEILGIIGPNGAGKTTLFDLISGFVPADRGTIVLGAEDITGCSVAERAWRGLGRSFQDARLFPALTVEETIAVALERWIDVRDPLNPALRLPAAFDSEEHVRQRVDELIELFGIESFRSRFVRELSTGSRRVVDLACVAAHRPTVVLLDEPSSGIAQRETEALGPLLERLRDGLGAALVVVEHDVPLVTRVADRIIAMDQGAVIADGPPSEVLSDGAVVASYLGSDRHAIARSGVTPGGES
jgi:ABC-type branched-subunit amino acid transport system ATPase component/sugar phosphate permease